MRLRALAAGAGLALLTPILAVLFGQEFARGAVHLIRGSFMMGWFAVFALPFLALAVLFSLGAMGVAGAAGAAARS